MAWPTTAVATGDLITAAQLNLLPIKLAETIVTSSPPATIEFTSIPSFYGHLRIIAYLRSDGAGATTTGQLRFNNDTGTNYDYQRLFATAATTTATELFATNTLDCTVIPASTAGANLFALLDVVIAHYANAANNKVVLTHAAHKSGTTTGLVRVTHFAGFWRNNAAITQVTVRDAGGAFSVGSRATLYALP